MTHPIPRAVDKRAAAHIVRSDHGLGHVEHQSGSGHNYEGHVDEPEDVANKKLAYISSS